MNNTQKLFYRYKFEQKLPRCIQHKLTPISIHQVINSKDSERIRRYNYPLHFGYRRRKDNIKAFVYHALYQNDIKMLRVVIKRFPNELLEQVYTVIPKGEDKKRYTPFRLFKGWKLKLNNLK